MQAENDLSKQIVDAAYHIHKSVGPGLLESVYETLLANALQKRGIQTIRQHPIPMTYDGIHLDTAFKADLLVANRVIVELKSVEVILPVHKKQLLTYLRLSNKRLGLLINFNVELIKQGITRIIN